MRTNRPGLIFEGLECPLVNQRPEQTKCVFQIHCNPPQKVKVIFLPFWQHKKGSDIFIVIFNCLKSTVLNYIDKCKTRNKKWFEWKLWDLRGGNGMLSVKKCRQCVAFFQVDVATKHEWRLIVRLWQLTWSTRSCEEESECLKCAKYWRWPHTLFSFTKLL